jgi:hypothetical protein
MFNILSDERITVESLDPYQNLEFNLIIENNVQLPAGHWLSSGNANIVTTVTAQIVNDENPSGGRYFRNPESKTHGFIAAISDGFVVEQKAISYRKQLLFKYSDYIAIENTRQDTAIRLGKDITTGMGHSYSIAAAQVCGVGVGIVPTNGTPAILGIDAIIGEGGICLRSLPEEEGYTQLSVFEPPSASIVTIDRLNNRMVTGFSGILYAGKTMLIAVATGYVSESNQAPIPQPPGFLVGDSQFPVYQYNCLSGILVSNPSNPPCPAAQTGVPPNGTGVYNGDCNGIPT